MSRTLIHAGNLKTGSTAIQAVLMRLRPKLAERGVMMPGLEAGDRAHYKLAHETKLTGQAVGGPATRQMRVRLKKRDPSEVTLLTSETFMSSSPKELHDLMASARVKDPTILFYVRPHASLIASLYLQHIKTGIYMDSIEDRLTHLGRLAAIMFIERIEHYSTVFGKGALMVREFSRDRLVDKSIVADFWKAFQLPEDLFAQALATEEVRNPTPTQEVALLVRAIGLHMQAQKSSGWTKAGGQTLALSFFRNLSRQSPDLPGTQFRLPLAVQESMAAAWDSPRAAFASRWFSEPPRRVGCMNR